MPTVLRDYQHELTTDYEDGNPAVVSLVFGTIDTSYLTTTPPNIEGSEAKTGDVQRFREDGINFGEDFEGGKLATFEVGVVTDRATDPQMAGGDALDAFEAAWKDRRLRNDPTRYAVLRSRAVPGRTRRAYGRPRRYSPTTGLATRRGYTPFLCDFQTIDGTWYDDDAQSVSLTLARSGVDGMLEASTQTADGRWVFATLAASSTGSTTPPDGYLPSVAVQQVEPTTFTIGGSEPTWPVVTFHAGSSASVQNPKATIGGLTVGLADTIPAGESVKVDPRPWSRAVLRSDGASKAGRCTYDTPPLRRLMLYPGDYTLNYDGVDTTGTSWVEVSWRNAYSRW